MRVCECVCAASAAAPAHHDATNRGYPPPADLGTRSETVPEATRKVYVRNEPVSTQSGPASCLTTFPAGILGQLVASDTEGETWRARAQAAAVLQ